MLYFNDDKLHDRIVRVRFSSLLFGISFSFFFFQRGRFDFYDCSIILILSYLLRRPGSVDFSTRTTTSINVFYGVVSFGRPSPAWRRGVVKPLSFFFTVGVNNCLTLPTRPGPARDERRHGVRTEFETDASSRT